MSKVKEKMEVGYITGEQSDRGHQTHMPEGQMDHTCFWKPQIQDTVMANANQINEHVAPK